MQSVVAGGGATGKYPFFSPANFLPVGKLSKNLFARKFSSTNAKFGAEKPHVPKFRSKIEILSTQSFLWKICSVAQKTATFCPTYFLTYVAATAMQLPASRIEYNKRGFLHETLLNQSKTPSHAADQLPSRNAIRHFMEG